MADLAGKRVIVTGGSTGIGAAIAERFLADGAKVCVWGQSQERLDAIAAKLPKLSAAISVDVADADSVDPAFAARWRASAASTFSSATPASRSAMISSISRGRISSGS